ncbi:putative beta-sarcoglycan [Danaus plexippus plexippus]|uniref:Beta-sarcoglycan n=1 Tax=Danaus plexippus plexippus TaxID=278856 RepID=A0A212F9V6_DANPL|nr:putative beta-sarcoglycan [Danaus plexippus plexippus]
MAPDPSGGSPSDMTDHVDNRGKALLTPIPSNSQAFLHTFAKNYSDKNGNDVTRDVRKGRRTFVFWILVFLLLVTAVGNLVLTFSILGVLRLGSGLESMEFLPLHDAVKFLGDTNLDNIYKKDGLIESFRDTPLSITSENGSVLITLQTRAPRSETKLIVNTTGVFIKGVTTFNINDPDSGVQLFSSGNPEVTVNENLNSLNARQVSTKRISSPVDEDLVFRSDASAYLRGAEGTHMESKELYWSADQDIHLRSANGSVILSGKEGVFVDVRYLPIALPSKEHHGTGQFKVCVCMPQGKLFRIAVPDGQRVTCSHINTTGDLNPCG